MPENVGTGLISVPGCECDVYYAYKNFLSTLRVRYNKVYDELVAFGILLPVIEVLRPFTKSKEKLGNFCVERVL